MTLALPGLVTSSVLATRAWSDWQSALTTARSVHAIGELMHTASQLMLTRGLMHEDLRAAAPDYEPLAQAATASDTALGQAQQALLQADLPTQTVRQARDDIALTQRLLSAAISHRAVVPSPLQSLSRIIKDLDEEALRIQRRITLANPSVGLVVELARTAHEMRETAGRRAMFLNIWFGGQDLGAREREEMFVLTGHLAGAWDRLDQGVHAFTPTQPVSAAMDSTRDSFFLQREPWYRDLVKTAASGGNRPMSYQEYRLQTVAALAQLLPLRETLLTEAEATSFATVHDARVDLWVAGGTAAASLALVAAVMLLLLRGLIQPVHRMTLAMTSLAGNDLSAPIPSRSRLCEVAAMAHALTVFRDNLDSLHQREAELARINRQFDAALANMSQGLCMFDPRGRLIVANEQLVATFGLPTPANQPGRRTGARYRDLVEHAVRDGTIARRDAAWLLNQRIVLARSKYPVAFLWELADDRAFAVHYRPMAGGSWLATFEDVTEQRKAVVRIAHMAHHDTLTGLPNRVLFRERLGEALARTRRGDHFAVLCLDLDHFKAVNDTLGHPIGDALLRAVAERLHLALRETDIVARLGGDEFAILQTSAEQPRDATVLARRLVETLGAPYQIEAHQVVIGVSVGIALAPGDGDDADTLMKNADLALYRVKADGRAAWRFFEPEMDARMQARRLLELELRRALANGEFEVHYQPLVDANTHRATGFEALLRWRHPERGLVLPGEFLPLAEEIGLIGPLGEWVLRRACAEAATWPGNEKIAVNLSATQFRVGLALAEVVADALDASGLSPSRLDLEVTEGVMLQDTEETLATLHRIRALGVSISMDDFGTGYSSLSYLRRFPFTKVKIDQSFIRGLSEAGDDCAAIVRAVVGLCGSLGMATTAEGVETEEQLGRLASEGCTEVQGYFFSRPVPASAVPGLLGRPLATMPARVAPA